MLASLTDQLSAWGTVVLAVVAVLGGIVAVAKWAHKVIMRDVREALAPIKAEVLPNGGSSLADSVRRQEIVGSQTAKAVENLTLRFDEHVDHHS